MKKNFVRIKLFNTNVANKKRQNFQSIYNPSYLNLEIKNYQWKLKTQNIELKKLITTHIDPTPQKNNPLIKNSYKQNLID